MSSAGRWLALFTGVLALSIGSPGTVCADKFFPPLSVRRDTLEHHVADLVWYLKGTDATNRDQAESGLILLGPKAKTAVPVLVDRLKDGTPEQKRRACDILAYIGPDARPALPRLVEFLMGKDQAVEQYQSTFVHGGGGPSITRDRVDSLHRSAVNAVAGLGPEAKDAVPALKKLIDDDKSHARDLAVCALWAITKDPDVVRTSFLRILKTPGADERSTALSFFLELGPDGAKDALPTIRAIARDPKEEDLYLKAQAAFALWKLEKHKEAVPLLLTTLKGSHRRFVGAEFLVEIGAPAKDAIPVLIDRVKNAKATMPTFTQLSQEASDKRYGAECLGRFGPDAKAAVDVLCELLEDRSPYVRIDACVALWRIERSDTALAKLNDYLTDKNPELRLYVASQLHELGRVPKAAAPAITELLRYEDYEIRDRAAELLKRIDPKAEK